MTSNVFNNLPNYVSYNSIPAKEAAYSVKEAIPAVAAFPSKGNSNIGPEYDVVNLKQKTKTKTKKGPVKTIKCAIASIKKFFSTIGEYSKGLFKGIKNGAVSGSILYTGAKIFNYIQDKGAKKAAETAGEVAKQVKHLPAPALALGAAVVSIGAALWNASLNATERKSDIDHRWTGHNK